MSDELQRHLERSGREGAYMAVGLAVAVIAYVAAIWAANWNIGVVIAGAIVLLVVILLAYRIRRATFQEIDRLIDGVEPLDISDLDD